MSKSLDAKTVKNSLTIQEVERILEECGAAPEYVNDNELKAIAVCHKGDSRIKKLHYYDDTKLFYCYSNCGSFDIYDFLKFALGIDKFYDRLKWVAARCSDISYKNVPAEPTKQDLREMAIRELPTYVDDFSSLLDVHTPWEQENISREVALEAGIRYDKMQDCIVIPHRDIKGNLVGVRRRAYKPESIDRYGKYSPWYFYKNKTLFRSETGSNLYGIDLSAHAIAETKKALIVEGEKSVLQVRQMVGTDKSIAVATCGNRLTKFQMRLLIELGVEEVIVAFDKDYLKDDNEAFQRYTDTLSRIKERFSEYAKISFVWDCSGKLGYKDSPTEHGLSVFAELYNNRTSNIEDIRQL